MILRIHDTSYVPESAHNSVFLSRATNRWDDQYVHPSVGICAPFPESPPTARTEPAPCPAAAAGPGLPERAGRNYAGF